MSRCLCGLAVSRIKNPLGSAHGDLALHFSRSFQPPHPTGGIVTFTSLLPSLGSLPVAKVSFANAQCRLGSRPGLGWSRDQSDAVACPVAVTLDTIGSPRLTASLVATDVDATLGSPRCQSPSLQKPQEPSAKGRTSPILLRWVACSRLTSG